ncbi:MAG: phosphomannose isomerase type II C-terminal cupin domain [Gammaproteobacteria bacterium]|nr:phosphomannose isomerase type II C-terminal cupin domain [Gammaproteobacteria bacterium]
MSNVVGKIYERPWGTYKTIDLGDGYQVKLITVKPRGRLSLQKHFQRSEHWVVISGVPTITVGEEARTYQVNEHIYIDKEMPHRMENLTEKPAAVIEVQVGSYLGEDDIVRLDDIYGRV